MKKITFLLFFAFLSTSMLFAQSKELTKTTDSQTLQVNKNASPLALLKVQGSETNTVKSAQTGSLDSEMPILELSEVSNASKDLAMKKRLKENEAKSHVSKAERDNLSDAIKERLEKPQKNTSTLEKRNLDLEKQRIDLEKRREIARKKALQNYVAPSSKELTDKKSNK